VSAAVFDIRSGQLIADACNSTETEGEAIKRLVLAQLRGKVRGSVIDAAIVHAKRIRREEPKTSIGKAVQRGVVRAVCEDDNHTTPPDRAA
jgi:hypothetical protein